MARGPPGRFRRGIRPERHAVTPEHHALAIDGPDGITRPERRRGEPGACPPREIERFDNTHVGLDQKPAPVGRNTRVSVAIWRQVEGQLRSVAGDGNDPLVIEVGGLEYQSAGGGYLECRAAEE